MPIAMNAAFWPTTPPPMIITVAAATPGTPPSSTPRPPRGRSRKNAPAWVAILPATSPPPPARGAPKEDRARLGCDLAGHLAHRREQRKPASLVHHGLVGDAGGPA